jgi:hypothetical protein
MTFVYGDRVCFLGTELALGIYSFLGTELKFNKIHIEKCPKLVYTLTRKPEIPVSKRSGLMKKRTLSLIALFAIIALVSISCKSTPDEKPEERAAPRVSASTQVDDSRGHMDRVTEARKRAMDFESPAYFPSEWEALEVKYNDAVLVPFQSAVQQANVLFDPIAEEYDEIFKKAVPLYAQAREDEIISIRDELISSGFISHVPEYLENVDKIALAALDQYEAEDYYKARDTAAEALKEYELLMVGARVYLTRQEVLDRGFNEYDLDNFEKADEVAGAAIDAYEAGKKDETVANAEEATLRYNIVLANGWTAYSSIQQASASAEKDLAIADKVHIASRDSFRDADAIFSQADEAFNSGEFHEAAILYTEAEAHFAVARRETEEKRQRAMESIRMASERMELSIESAIEAERLIEGGSR